MEVQQRDVPVQVVGQLEGIPGSRCPGARCRPGGPTPGGRHGETSSTTAARHEFPGRYIYFNFFLQTIDRVLCRASKCWGSAFTPWCSLL